MTRGGELVTSVRIEKQREGVYSLLSCQDAPLSLCLCEMRRGMYILPHRICVDRNALRRGSPFLVVFVRIETQREGVYPSSLCRC